MRKILWSSKLVPIGWSFSCDPSIGSQLDLIQVELTSFLARGASFLFLCPCAIALKVILTFQMRHLDAHYDHQSVINTKLGSQQVYVTGNLIFDLYSLLFVFSNVLTSLDHLRSSLTSRKHRGAKLKTTFTGLLTCGRNLVSIR